MKQLFYRSFIALSILGIAFTGCSDDDDSGDNMNPDNQNSDLPSAIVDQAIRMTFTSAQTGAPYSEGQEVDFTFSDSGEMTLDENPDANDGNEVLVTSFSESGNEFIWKDENAGFDYKLSLKSDNSINEINVFKASDNTFMGQFVELGGGSNDNIVSNYAGSYSVTSVDKGTHTRMTVTIDADGNIDFDSGIQLMASDFALISDRLACCDGIWIDMNPYPTEPYPRVNLFVDPSSGDLNKIEYLPENPSIANRVTVNLSKGTGGGNSNELTVSGDFSKVGGASFTPDLGLECTSCASSEKFTWTQKENSNPDRVFSIELFSNGQVVLDFSAGSAFAASGADLMSMGISWDKNAKTFSFANVNMNERFSQPGKIAINGTLTYQ